MSGKAPEHDVESVKSVPGRVVDSLVASATMDKHPGVFVESKEVPPAGSAKTEAPKSKPLQSTATVGSSKDDGGEPPGAAAGGAQIKEETQVAPPPSSSTSRVRRSKRKAKNNNNSQQPQSNEDEDEEGWDEKPEVAAAATVEDNFDQESSNAGSELDSADSILASTRSSRSSNKRPKQGKPDSSSAKPRQQPSASLTTSTTTTTTATSTTTTSLTTTSTKQPSSKANPATSKPQNGAATNNAKPATMVPLSKGKSRRIIFKKSSTKAPVAVSRAVTSDRIFFKGQYFTKGDIVSVVDVDGGVFYAQLRGFLTDQYCEKSCVITWLLPTVHSPPPASGFDPATYIIGPEEELPRRLDHFTFVMHSPDDYFYYKNAPYPTDAVVQDQEYVLTRLGQKVRLLRPDGKAVFC